MRPLCFSTLFSVHVDLCPSVRACALYVCIYVCVCIGSMCSDLLPAGPGGCSSLTSAGLPDHRMLGVGRDAAASSIE